MRLPWTNASSAPLGTETKETMTLLTWCPLYTLLLSDGKTTFPLYLFQLAVGCSCRIQNSFQPRNETSRANYLSSCGHVIFSIFYVKQPKYANISRFTDCRKRYFHFQLAFDKSTLLIDSIQWLFSVVCLALNAGEQTATSNRCDLLFRLLF